LSSRFFFFWGGGYFRYKIERNDCKRGTFISAHHCFDSQKEEIYTIEITGLFRGCLMQMLPTQSPQTGFSLLLSKRADSREKLSCTLLFLRSLYVTLCVKFLSRSVMSSAGCGRLLVAVLSRADRRAVTALGNALHGTWHYLSFQTMSDYCLKF